MIDLLANISVKKYADLIIISYKNVKGEIV